MARGVKARPAPALHAANLFACCSPLLQFDAAPRNYYQPNFGFDSDFPITQGPIWMDEVRHGACHAPAVRSLSACVPTAGQLRHS